MMDWQPIETAPKGKAILVYDPSHDHPRVAQWMTAMDDGEGAWIYARKLSWQEPMMGKALSFIVVDPTHWMPLPEPPK